MPLPVFHNPNNDDSLTGTFNEVLREQLRVTDDMLPARVISYDRSTNRAIVQPQIQMIDTEGNLHSRAPNSNVPVLLLGAGNFFISFHLPPDSLGWIKASDRDLSLFRTTFTERPPNTLRMHTFEDSLFIPDVMTGHNIAAEDAQAMVISNTDGTVRVSLNEARIKLTAPLVEIDGNVTVSGTTEFAGDTQFDGAVNVGPVNLVTHIHVTPAGPSDGPTPGRP